MIGTIGQQNSGIGKARKNTKLMFEEDGKTFETLISELTAGLSIVYVNVESDLPLVVKQDTGYIILNPFIFSASRIIPAGWRGFIRSSNFFTNILLYTGAGDHAFTTLDNEGDIASIESNGAGGIRVLTTAPHNIENGDFINLTNTASEVLYSQQRLLVSNVLASSFEIEQIPFTVTSVGNFDSGALMVDVRELTIIHLITGTDDNMVNIKFTTDPNSIFLATNSVGLNFARVFKIQNVSSGLIQAIKGSYRFEGINLVDCVDVSVQNSKLQADGFSDAIAASVAISGAATRDITLFNSKFNSVAPSQFAVRIKDDITTEADINIMTCPDNSVNDKYFSDAVDELDQTDKEIITLNNGKRQNSQDIAEIRTKDAHIEINSIQNTEVKVIDVSQANGDFLLDPASEGFSVNSQTGTVTYNGRKTKRFDVSYSAELAQFSNPTQIIVMSLRQNGNRIDKSEQTIITTDVNVFAKVSYDGGLLMIAPGDTFELYEANLSNSINTKLLKGVIKFV